MASPLQPVSLPLLDASGRLVTRLLLYPTRRGEEPADTQESSLFLSPEATAGEQGEQPIQLRERERYEYEIEDHKYALIEEGGVSRSRSSTHRGFIETADFCGCLQLRLCRPDDGENPCASGLVEVRSKKLGYREDYRWMLEAIAKKSAALLFDAHANIQQRLESLWDKDSPLMEQQMEFLRHCLDSPAFSSAIDQILRFPHQRMERKHELRNISRAGKLDRAVVRQLTRGGGDRVAIPAGHPAHAAGLTSVPRQVEVSIGDDFRDTAENRFIKMVLEEFRDFLGNITAFLDREEADERAKGKEAPKARLPLRRDCRRLSLKLNGILSHTFFQDLSRPTVLPLGSPVLQRKTGYREIYHFWLQFHASAQLSWEGGSEIWRAGARNVATLYEYWLFFELEELFREKFKCTEELHSLLVEKDHGITRMKLKRGVEMGTPAKGVWSEKAQRHLSAHFYFNKKFNRTQGNEAFSSWTRNVQPDYTISIWPTAFTPAEAEENELMVHIHFDAKYRVTNLEGFEEPRDGDEETIQDQASAGDDTSGIRSTAAKYSDLLKMHAYRDAIRRTGGAYVLYPGESKHEPFRSNFHEILPGLGAFSIRPANSGKAKGIEVLSTFLDTVIDHLSNRTTAHERSRYHLGESLSLKEEAVPYRTTMLPEKNQFDVAKRAVPPEEHKILVVWSKDDSQLTQWKGHQIAHVRLGSKPGGLTVELEVAEVRHLLVRRSDKVLMDLLKLTSRDFTIHTGEEMLKTYGIKASEPDGIYAVFNVEEDPAFKAKEWNEERIWKLIEEKAQVASSGKLHRRRSADPVVLSLRSLLKESS
jgi:predicted component of viral defense system (DUF524 family)